MAQQMNSLIDIEKYRGWALNLAAPYAARSGQTLLDSDAYGDACVGLLNAARLFNRDLGYDFSTYARVCIKRAIRDGINSRRLEKHVDGAVVRMTLSSEIASRAGDICESAIDTAQRREESARLAAGMRRLPDRNRDVILARLDGKTLEEIGESRGISREMVRRIEAESHILLRQMMLTRSA